MLTCSSTMVRTTVALLQIWEKYLEGAKLQAIEVSRWLNTVISGCQPADVTKS